MAYRAIGTINLDADGGTSITPAAVASVDPSDYLIIVVVADTSSDPVTAWPSGFTDGGIAHATPAQAGNTTVTFAYKPSGTALPGSYAVSTNATGRCMAVMIAWSGRSSGAPTITLTNSAGSGSGAGPRNCTLSGLTANSTDDICWIGAASSNAATTTWGPPTNYTEIADQANGNDGLGIAIRDNVSSGATGNVVGTSSGGSGVDLMGILVAFPVSSGAGTATPGVGAVTMNGRAPTTSAFQNVRIREVLVNGSGQVVGNAANITLLVWYSGVFGGAPDVSLNGQTTDANGTTSWSIATGTLAFNQKVAYVAQDSISWSNYTAARMTPSYE